VSAASDLRYGRRGGGWVLHDVDRLLTEIDATREAHRASHLADPDRVPPWPSDPGGAAHCLGADKCPACTERFGS